MGKLHKWLAISLCMVARSSKVKKIIKKGLTNENESAIIHKLSASGQPQERHRTENREKSTKKVEKLLKNLLTNEEECDIMCLTSALRGVRENGLKKSRKNVKKF